MLRDHPEESGPRLVTWQQYRTGARPNRVAARKPVWDDVRMAERIMFVQLKTGHDIDRGPAWISVVSFSRSWRTATWHGRRLRRTTGLFDANFVDEETGDWYWLSGPRRDLGDTRYARVVPTVDDDAAQAYREFVDGASLPGREQG